MPPSTALVHRLAITLLALTVSLLSAITAAPITAETTTFLEVTTEQTPAGSVRPRPPLTETGAAAEAPVDVSKIPLEDAVLDAGKQKAIWDGEHYAHLLEWSFGPRFKEAFIASDRAALSTFFREGFGATVLEIPETPDLSAASVQRRRANAPGDKSTPVDTEGFIDWMAAMRKPLAEVIGVDFRILKIKEIGPGPEWEMLVLLGARGTGPEGAPISFQSTHTVRAIWENGEALEAGQIFKHWQAQQTTITTGTAPLMEEITRATGLDALPIDDNWTLKSRPVQKIRFQYAVDDYDRDGRLDIAIATIRGQLMLLRLDGERFVDVTASVGLPATNPYPVPNCAATWIDYNNDGYPDLLLGGQLYRNLEGKRFANVTKGSGLFFELPPIGFAVADYDLNGFLDILCLYSDAPKGSAGGRPAGWIGDDQSGAKNVLWKNNGKTGFTIATHTMDTADSKAHTMAATWFHADDDHFPDLYIANDFGRNVMLRNRGTRGFEDVSNASGSVGYATSMGVVSGDLDNDGRSEVYVSNMFSKAGRRVLTNITSDDYPKGIYEQIVGACAGNQLYTATGASGRFEEKAEALGVNQAGWAYGSAMVDFDNDGFLDLYSTAGFLSFERRKPDG